MIQIFSQAIDFNAHEKDDGFVSKVIFEGDSEDPIIIQSGVDRVKYFQTELVSIPSVYILIAIFIFIVAAYIYLLLSKHSPKSVAKLLFFFFSAASYFAL